MNSITLKENGFASFVPIKELSYSNIPVDNSSILVLVDSTLAGKPVSDILYIGKSRKPSKRVLGGYLSGYGSKKTRKINTMILRNGYLEKVAISWMISDNPKATQKKLLESFKKEHGEYPSWNGSKKLAKRRKAAPKKVKAALKSTRSKSAKKPKLS